MNNEPSYNDLRSKVNAINSVSMTYKATNNGVTLSNGNSSILIPADTLEKMFKEVCKIRGMEVNVRAREVRFYGRDR